MRVDLTVAVKVKQKMKLPTNILQLVIKWLFRHPWNTGTDSSDGKDMISSDYILVSYCRGLIPDFSGKIVPINI